MKVLFIGDIMGDPGIEAVSLMLAKFKNEGQQFDFVIANVENTAAGFGVNKDALRKISGFGFDCMTSGNHIWNRPEIYDILNDEKKLLRPANYPMGNPGFGWQAYTSRTGAEIAVINLQGRVYMQEIDCPFQAADRIFREIGERYKIVFVDFHADATSEKQAMGWYLDGRASAVIGTHTHVQSAEARILPQGTGFITDAGMCGPYDSVIGMQVEDALIRLVKGRPSRLRVATNNLKFAGVILEIDETSGKCISIQRQLVDVASAADNGA
jgi:metallophosphoesterase (TIGR00282 family)